MHVDLRTKVTPYTEKMSKLLALYLVIDLAALRWLLGIMNWGVLRWKNFSQHEIERHGYINVHRHAYKHAYQHAYRDLHRHFYRHVYRRLYPHMCNDMLVDM